MKMSVCICDTHEILGLFVTDSETRRVNKCYNLETQTHYRHRETQECKTNKILYLHEQCLNIWY